MGIPDATTIARQRERQRQLWGDDAMVAGWRRWHPQFARQSRAMTDALAGAARLRPGLRVLDLASGTGEPALTFAGLVSPGGTVTATDLSLGMVAAVADHARQRGLANVTCGQADAHDLPFADGRFEVVTSRLGVMFFPDPPRALGEAHRVLAPGGRAAFVAWGPRDENPFFAATGVFARRGLLPPSDPAAPSPFTYARSGALATALRGAGFGAVEETTARIALPWPGSPDEFWRFFLGINPTVSAAFGALPAGEREAAIAEVRATLGRYDDGGQVRLPATIHVATGVR